MIDTTRTPMASRVSGMGISVFAEISALAKELGAVNLGQGFPDFDGPEVIREALKREVDAGHNQYAISNGEMALRQAIATHSRRFYDQAVDPMNEVTVTSGATEALWCAAFAYIEPGDEVILFEPCYDSYIPAIRMAGGIPVIVTLHAPRFRFDPDELRAAFSPRTRAIYINTPHNPSGIVFTRPELELIADLCRQHDVLVIADEVYEHILYPGAEHLRMATLPGMWERTLTISSGGKSFSCTGWKVGWAIGPEALQVPLRRVHQFTVFATATPMQYAIAEALALPDSYFRELKEDYLARRDFLLDLLHRIGLRPSVPDGSYFIVADASGFPQFNGLEFTHFLLREVGVAVIPLSSFYLDPAHGASLVRFCFCKSWETLHAAAERLEKLVAV